LAQGPSAAMLRRTSAPGVRRSRAESELLGVSVAYLARDFLSEVDAAFGVGADPNYYDINQRMLCASSGRGYGLICPRDDQLHCSYVDAIGSHHASRATVMLSWSWQYTARTVVGALSAWCQKADLSLPSIFVWQCALCCNQYRVEARKALGEWEPLETFSEIFERRVCAIGHVLALITPWANSNYTDRMFCVFEFHTAMRVGACLEIVLPETEVQSFQLALEEKGMHQVWGAFAEVKLQRAKTSSPADRANILKLVDPDATDYENSPKCAALNAGVVKRLKQWFMESASGVVEEQLRVGQLALVSIQNVMWLLEELQEWERAEGIIKSALYLVKATGATETVTHAALIAQRGYLLHWQCCNEEAMVCFLEARALYEGLGVLQSTDYALLLSFQGVCRSKQGRFVEAMGFLQEAKAAWQAADASDSHDYAWMLTQMSRCLFSQGCLEDAAGLRETAKAAFEVAGSTRTPDFACLLVQSGKALLDQGRSQEAAACFQEAKLIYEAVGATNRGEYGDLLHRLLGFATSGDAKPCS